MDTGQGRYITAWVLMGALGAAATLGISPLDAGAAPSVAALAGLLLVAGRVELDFDFGRTRASYTLAEVAVTAGLLLLGPSATLVGAVIGMALAHTSRRLSPTKVVFNAGVVATALTVAGAILTLVPAVGPQVGGRPIAGVAVAMIGYGAVNLVAMLHLFDRLGATNALEGMRDQIPLTAVTMIAQVATGVVLALVWETDPWLSPLVLAPAAAIHLAARGAIRTTALLTTVRAERDHLTRVVDGASDGILLLDAAGEIRVWNPAMTDLTGIPAGQAIGRPVADVLHDDVRTRAEPVLDRWLIDDAHHGPAQRELEAELLHLDGSRRAIQESHALVFDDRGRCTGDVVVVRDVSRQYELERLRSDFVARVSHELRTPLTPIRGFVSVLLRRGDSLTTQQRHDALERIRERAEHLGTLVEDLLLVTRVDQGELNDLIDARPIRLEAVAQAAVVRAREQDPERTIEVHAAPGTPDALADPDRTRQVLDAVLDNACRYSPDGEPIEIDIHHQGDDVRIRVVDRGPGIPRDQREVIFDRFHRLEDPLTMRTSGVGLGLFLARQLTEAMHGTITVEGSPTGVGTAFVVALPTAEPAVSDVGETA